MVAGPAIEKLTASVVDAQSAEIDTVSGDGYQQCLYRRSRAGFAEGPGKL